MIREINVACSSNDSYAQHMGVMLFSLLSNCSIPSKVRIFVADGGISQINKIKITEMVSHFGAKISFVFPDVSKIEGIRTYKHFGMETYYRFYLFDNLKVRSLLYLDCDMIIEGDVVKLYDLKFKKNVVFAVSDPGGSDFKKRLLSIPLNKKYFNAGLLYVDCGKWRKNKISDKAIDYLKKNPDIIEYADQDALNSILVGLWDELDGSWNVISRSFYKKYMPWLSMNNAEERDYIKNLPNVIHYAGIVKPWFLIDRHPLKKRYLYYLRKTPWKDYRFPDTTFRGFLKRSKDYLKFVREKLNYNVKNFRNRLCVKNSA